MHCQTEGSPMLVIQAQPDNKQVDVQDKKGRGASAMKK
jgi:hypothetical protein